MDIDPWTKYEIARMRDEERLLHAREARLARELRRPEAEDIARSVESSWFAWLRRRSVPADQVTAGMRRV